MTPTNVLPSRGNSMVGGTASKSSQHSAFSAPRSASTGTSQRNSSHAGSSGASRDETNASSFRQKLQLQASSFRNHIGEGQPEETKKQEEKGSLRKN